MKKIDEMKASLEQAKTEAQEMLDTNKLEEAKAKLEEVKNMKKAIEMQEELDKEEEQTMKQEAKAEKEYTDKAIGGAGAIRAMIKKASGISLTEAENALLLPTTSATTGANGEGYILPEDVKTIIHKKIRQYRSLREVLGYIPTSALTGSFPIENFESVSGLIDFADGTDGTESSDISFTNVSFSLKEKAAFLKLSNTLLALTDNNLIEYVAEVFAKKAVITENDMAITALKKSKTVKKLADWKALKSSLNKDLDPAVMYGTVIVTNQIGFDYLDSQLDTTGRPMLQPNPANATQKLFNGYPVYVYSNSMLPSTAATASAAEKTPIFYGNLTEGVKFVDLQGNIHFEASKAAGFMSNTTVARLIEFVDVIQCDSSDKCYIYGEMETAPKIGA